jgi:hypothetical protein
MVVFDAIDKHLDAQSVGVAQRYAGDPHDANYDELDGAPHVENEEFVYQNCVYQTHLVKEVLVGAEPSRPLLIWLGKFVLLQWDEESGDAALPAEVRV